MRKIKILYTVNYLTNGGPTRVVQNLMKRMPREKYEVCILTLLNKNDHKIVDLVKKDNIKIYSLDFKHNRDIFLKRKMIIKKIKEINPNLIHVNGIEMSFVVTNKTLKCKKFTTIHNALYDDYKTSYGIIKGKIIEWLHIRWLKRFDLNICCSKSAYEKNKNKIDNIAYVRNGIEVNSSEGCNRVAMRKTMGINEKDFVYIYTGKLIERKRVKELIRLFEENWTKREKLLIVGDGPLMSECLELANENVILVGNRECVEEYLEISDAYISYSEAEGLSISVIEALSFGIPVLLSDIESHREFFEINKEVYIGELFNKESFLSKKNELKKKSKGINNESIRCFQRNNLSAISMAIGYQKMYEEHI